MPSLKTYNSFQVEASCQELIEITTTEQLQSLCANQETTAVHILGGGSNTLITSNLNTVWYVNIQGFDIVKQRDEYVLLRVGAGVDWHELVQYAVDNDWGGIENLALIPGKVGASPIQNIGAYGVEIGDCLISVSMVEKSTGNLLDKHVSQLGLGYRNSHFKNDWLGKYVIESIVIKLSKPGFHKINASYGAIREETSHVAEASLTIRDIFNAVIAIRSSKLPDPKVLGNGGSFFKNPIVEHSQYSAILEQYPTIPSYPVDEASVKIPAGWLIDQAGWKGRTIGNVGCYEKQALVLVNRGGASGKEVLEFSTKIQEDVKLKFGISLEREINVV